jgi:predicted HTH transcriptional regulator
VVNAVYHRSYEIREPVEIRVSREDLVVLSFPGPDRSIRLEDLKKGKAVSRRYRNPRIGEFLKELDLTEGRSTGISKIIRSMAANGSPAPEFETDEERSYFLIRLPVHQKATDWTGLLPGTSSEKSSEKNVAGSEKTSGDTADKIVEMIRQAPVITAGALAMELGISTRAVEKQVAKLKDSRRIQRIGSDKAGRWVVLEGGPMDARLEAPPAAQVVVDVGSVKTSMGTTQETTQKTSVKILEILRRSPELTLADVAEEIGLTRRAIEMASSKLVKEGRLRYVGPQKGGHWEVVK